MPRSGGLFPALLKRNFKIGKSPRKDEVFLVPIESLDKNGNGIVTIEWDTMQKQIEPTRLSVRGALPGETIRFRVVAVFAKGGSAIHTVRMNLFGRREHLIRPQTDNKPWRSTIEPDLLPAGHEESKDFSPFSCPHFDRRHDEQSCSGCTVPHMQYTRQLLEKHRLFKQALSGAVDDEILSNLQLVPRSSLTHNSNKHEVFAFSKRPLETPVWGQLSHQKPLPGEPRWKNFIPTPECKLLSKSGRALLTRFSQLIEAAHSDSPYEFSVHNEIINRGYLRSVIIQNSKNFDGKSQSLLTIVTATKPTGKLRSRLKEEIADRLLAEFPDQLKGVLLVEARTDTSRDDEFFGNNQQVIAGQGFVENYLPSTGKTVHIQPSCPSWVGSEILDSVAQELSACVSEKVMEIFSGNHKSITGILRSISADVVSIGDDQVHRLESSSELEEQSGEDISILPVEQLPDLPIGQADRVAPPSVIRDLQPRFEGSVVLSFPRNEQGKPEIKGVTSKKFRHWLGNVVRPKRIVMVTEHFEGLRKDIGHMKLLGYEIRRIKAFDTQPGRMDGILTVVMLEKKPGYTPLSETQLIP